MRTTTSPTVSAAAASLVVATQAVCERLRPLFQGNACPRDPNARFMLPGSVMVRIQACPKSCLLFPIVWLLIVVTPGAIAAVGDKTLARYLVADPIGGTTDAKADLTSIAQTFAIRVPGARFAIQGWNNAKTHTNFIEVASGLPQKENAPIADVRKLVTSACKPAQRTTPFQSIATVPNAYMTACRPLVHGKPLVIVAFVKKNVVILMTGYLALSRSALDTLAKHQYDLIPTSGIA